MHKIIKVLYAIIFFLALAVPSLTFFGVKETWRTLYGWESTPAQPTFTIKSFRDRSFQKVFTERFAKTFIPRTFFFVNVMQLHDWMNFGLFHYGYNRSLIEGENGILYEMPYVRFHLEHDRQTPKSKYDKVLAKLQEIDAFCASNGADFVFLSMPDKPQVYPEYLPKWYRWFWDYSEYDVQKDLTDYLERHGIKCVDGNALLREAKANRKEWLYPPGGTHLTCVGSALAAEAVLKRVNLGGRIKFNINPLIEGFETNLNWCVDNDLSELLNVWDRSHILSNVHLQPRFTYTNRVMNEGAAYFLGDCYRDQLYKIFGESRTFLWEKMRTSLRQGEHPARLRAIAKDLRLVLLTFQSFNTGALYDRLAELDSILSALKRAHGELVVHLPENTSAVEQTAAKELKNAVARMGAYADFDFIIRSDASLGEDGIAITPTAQGLVLAGHPTRGPIYAVNEYLERYCGVRWWTKDESNYPRLERLPYPSQPYHYTPPFRFRETFSYDPLTDALFKVRMKSNCSSYTRYILPPTKEDFIPATYGGNHKLVFFPGRRSAFHSFFQVIPPAKYFKDHPEWFSLVNGKRFALTGDCQSGQKCGGQLCLTNEEMFREYVRETKRLLRENPDCDAIQVSQNDWNCDWCECEKCQAIYDREGAISGAYIDFANRVAEAIENEFPNITIDTFAYLFTRKAPRFVRPRKNVLVRLCDIECAFNQPLAFSPESFTKNTAFMKDLNDWSKVAKGQLYIWDYQANFTNYLLPHPNLKCFGPNLRTFCEFGAQGVFEQGDGMCRAGDFTALKQWVTAHLVWNPLQDGWELVQEFVAGYYGPAAPHIMNILELASASASRTEAGEMGIFRATTQPWITEDCFREVMSEFAKAKAAVQNDCVFLHRVQTAALSWDQVRILTWKDWNKGASEAERQEAINQWVNALRARGVNTHRETVDPKTFENYISNLKRAP